MGQKVKLREICHARSGDKGADINIGIAVYDPEHYSWLEENVTAEVVADYLEEYLKGVPNASVTRYDLPKLGAFNFLVRGGLHGGVTRSLILDGHGKSFSQIILDLEIEAPQ